jgi:EpsI family protein
MKPETMTTGSSTAGKTTPEAATYAYGQPETGAAEVSAELSSELTTAASKSPRAMTSALLRFGVVAALMLGTAILLQRHSRSEIFPPRLHLSSLPLQIDGWTGTDDTLDPETLAILGPGEFLVRDYVPIKETANQPQNQQQYWVNLYLAYFPSQKTGDTIHSPNHCLPGAGWVPISREVVQITWPDGSSFPVNRYVISKLGDRQLVLYWFQAHGRVVASEYWAKYYLVADSIKMNRSDGALVRLMTPMRTDETADEAQARVMKFGSQLLPLLDSYIPR